MALFGKQAKTLGAKPQLLPKKIKKPGPSQPAAPQGSTPPKPVLKAGMMSKLKGGKPA
jgi:hypothetical protein